MQDSNPESARSSFERAVTFLRAGDAATAESICRHALNEFPREANLLCLLGATLIRQDQRDDAEHTLTRAVQLYPDFARAQEGLGEVLVMQGKLPAALEALQRAEKLEPGNAEVRMKLAKVLSALGRDDEANREFEESFRLTPHREELVRGLQLQRVGDIRQAENIYRSVLTKDPDNVDALRLLAGVALRARQWGDAEALLTKALELAPDFYQGWMDLGLARQEKDDIAGAVDAYQRAVRLEPERASGHAASGTVRAMAGQHDDAIKDFRQALVKDAGHPGALCGLGHTLKTVGRQSEAIDAYRRCIAANTRHGEAYWSLANLKTFRFSDKEVQDMQLVLEDESLADESRANIQFALGKAFEDADHIDTAFTYYKAGNDNRRQRETYDPVQTADLYDDFVDVFSNEFLAANRGFGYDSRAPIFIVGLPRSGSTLIEQILASHPDVEGTHELPDLSRVARTIGTAQTGKSAYPRSVIDAEQTSFRALGEDYLQRTRRHRPLDLPRFTDKLPNNFVHVGLLQLILPNARVIDARRHPLDSCLGSYKQLFARGQPFTYDLFELGEFYLEYRRLMDHWDAVAPGAVLAVQYEDVVADLEGQVRRLLDFCKLPWNDACLDFHRSERAVKTASSEQVRQPIYSSSVQLWRRYETHLAPLIEVLEPLLKELPDDWQPDSLSAA